MREINHERIRELAEEYANTFAEKRAGYWWKVFNAYKRGCYVAIKNLDGEIHR